MKNFYVMPAWNSGRVLLSFFNERPFNPCPCPRQLQAAHLQNKYGDKVTVWHFMNAEDLGEILNYGKGFDTIEEAEAEIKRILRK